MRSVIWALFTGQPLCVRCRVWSQDRAGNSTDRNRGAIASLSREHRSRLSVLFLCLCQFPPCPGSAQGEKEDLMRRCGGAGREVTREGLVVALVSARCHCCPAHPLPQGHDSLTALKPWIPFPLLSAPVDLHSSAGSPTALRALVPAAASSRSPDSAVMSFIAWKSIFGHYPFTPIASFSRSTFCNLIFVPVSL